MDPVIRTQGSGLVMAGSEGYDASSSTMAAEQVVNIRGNIEMAMNPNSTSVSRIKAVIVSEYGGSEPPTVTRIFDEITLDQSGGIILIKIPITVRGSGDDLVCDGFIKMEESRSIFTGSLLDRRFERVKVDGAVLNRYTVKITVRHPTMGQPGRDIALSGAFAIRRSGGGTAGAPQDDMISEPKEPPISMYQ